MDNKLWVLTTLFDDRTVNLEGVFTSQEKAFAGVKEQMAQNDHLAWPTEAYESSGSWYWEADGGSTTLWLRAVVPDELGCGDEEVTEEEEDFE